MDELDPLLNVLGSSTAENTKRIEAVDDLARLIRTQRGFKTATALDILLRILEDPTDYDLLRIEVLKVLEYTNDTPEEHKRIGESIIKVLLRTEDNYLMREWAARVVTRYMDVKGAVQATLQTVLDTTDDEVVRENAFGAMEDMDPTSEVITAMTTLEQEGIFENEASSALTRWGQHG
jgi:hypothetical protein